MSRSSKNNAWNEVVAIILLGVGTLLFLALISYNPKDLPSWVPWSYLSPPNKPAQNFIGPFGAILASFCYLTLGAASYFLAGVLLFFGAMKLFHANLRLVARLPWTVLFIASGACLLQLQTTHLRGWRTAFNIQGPGGWVGYVFGKDVATHVDGQSRIDHSARRNLRRESDSDDRTATDSSRAANGFRLRAPHSQDCTNGALHRQCATPTSKDNSKSAERNWPSNGARSKNS